MKRTNFAGASAVIGNLIGTSYDTVKKVADNMADVQEVAANIEALLNVDSPAVVAARDAAIAAQVAAEAALDSFDDRYLGVKTSGPAVDNDGNALLTGAMYFNSTNDTMYVRTSAPAWAVAGSEAAQTAAAQSATDAATAETNAVTAETNAVTAQVAAETALDTFTDLYLGAKAGDPALDNDGNALQTGALYQNTTAVPDELRFYDGTVWAAIPTQNIAPLSSSSDVLLTALADGEHIEWDEGQGMWVNTSMAAQAVLSVAGRIGAVTLVKADVGLASVDNTADSTKPVSTAGQTALDLKANAASPAFTGTPTGITATHVGLSNLDNTADAAKPVSTAMQNALDLKATIASPTFSGIPAVPTAPPATNTTQAASTAFVEAAVASGSGTGDAVVHTGTWNASTNTPNLTTVAAKGVYYVVSAAGSTNLSGHTSWAIGDWVVSNGVTWDFIDNTAGAGGAVDSVAGRTGTVVLTKADVGLSNVDDTDDIGKPVSSATNTELGLKAPVASPTLTGTPAVPTAAPGTNTTQIASTAYVFAGMSGLDKTDVGLANVDNTTDVAKPISTSTQTALNLKAPLNAPTFTGIPAAPTASPATNTTQIASTAFVEAAVAAGGGGGGGLYNAFIDQDLAGVSEIYIDAALHPNCRWRMSVDQVANGSFQVQIVSSTNGVSFISNSVDMTRYAINPESILTEETDNDVSFAPIRSITARAYFRGQGFIGGRAGANLGSWISGDALVASLSSTIMTGSEFWARSTRQYIGFRFSSAVDVGRLVVEELV